ncbi:hypothetical protein GQ457_04G016530 [Hibiscus cannabinus]
MLACTWRENLRQVILETDCLEIVIILTHTSRTLVSDGLVKSIFEWTRRDWKLAVRHVSRDCNHLADRLAALGRTTMRSGALLPDPPASFTTLVEEDTDCNLVDLDISAWVRPGNTACFNLMDDPEKYYPKDFSEHDKYHLEYELELFYRDVSNHAEMKNLSTITQLCQSLSESGKSFSYPLVDRLIRFILTLLVSTTTTERAFSVMKIAKTSLRNKMEDEFLSDYLIVYIEKEIAEKFTFDSIIDDFDSTKIRRFHLNR